MQVDTLIGDPDDTWRCGRGAEGAAGGLQQPHLAGLSGFDLAEDPLRVLAGDFLRLMSGGVEARSGTP